MASEEITSGGRLRIAGAPIAHNVGMTRRLLLPLLAALLLPACAGTPSSGDAAGATFIVVRHGEKTSDTERDPDLSAAGIERARQLAQRLAGDDITAIYTTDYRRTRQTVEPIATAHRIDAETYDAKLPAHEFAARLKAAHPRGTVLVAGHSNTVPDIVAALCGCEAAPMPETEYDRLSTVHVAADGSARLQVTRFGAPAHAP